MRPFSPSPGPIPGERASSFWVKIGHDGRLPYQPHNPPGNWKMSQNTLHAPSRCNSRLVVPLAMFEICNPANADFILHPTFLILLTLIFCQTLANPCPVPRIAFHTMRTAHTEPKPHRLVEFNHNSHLKVSFK